MKQTCNILHVNLVRYRLAADCLDEGTLDRKPGLVDVMCEMALGIKFHLIHKVHCDPDLCHSHHYVPEQHLACTPDTKMLNNWQREKMWLTTEVNTSCGLV